MEKNKKQCAKNALQIRPYPFAFEEIKNVVSSLCKGEARRDLFPSFRRG